jgi:hypothetical protein
MRGKEQRSIERRASAGEWKRRQKKKEKNQKDCWMMRVGLKALNPDVVVALFEFSNSIQKQSRHCEKRVSESALDATRTRNRNRNRNGNAVGYSYIANIASAFNLALKKVEFFFFFFYINIPFYSHLFL